MMLVMGGGGVGVVGVVVACCRQLRQGAAVNVFTLPETHGGGRCSFVQWVG
jgi:hypothetical protein